ncbi:hypothetical protein Hanom_Chr09g00771651 [Helianthus anomalus]
MRRVENSMLFTGLVTDKGRMGLFTRKRVGVGVFVEGSVMGFITKAILMRWRFLGAFFSVEGTRGMQHRLVRLIMGWMGLI